MSDIIKDIVQICIIPLLGILIKYLGDYLATKKEAIKMATDSEIAKKYTDMVYQTVIDCVMATNQTYVDTLKKTGNFTPEAQKEAFNRTMQAVLAILTEDAKEYIQQATGDLNTYLTQLIEAQVKAHK